MKCLQTEIWHPWWWCKIKTSWGAIVPRVCLCACWPAGEHQLQSPKVATTTSTVKAKSSSSVARFFYSIPIINKCCCACHARERRKLRGIFLMTHYTQSVFGCCAAARMFWVCISPCGAGWDWDWGWLVWNRLSVVVSRFLIVAKRRASCSYGPLSLLCTIQRTWTAV